jgi:uncharacterized protein YwqG
MTDDQLFERRLRKARDEMRKIAQKAGLGSKADGLAALIEPAVLLVPSQEPASLIGATKIGGQPDLPAGFAWPLFKEKPLSFVAQIALGDLVGLPGTATLPVNGLLSFFFDSTQQAWGFDPAERDGFRVCYFPSATPLRAVTLPAGLPDDARFRALSLRPKPEVSWPAWESADVDTLLDEDELGAYLHALPEVDEPPRQHQLLGHPAPVQGDMQVEAQLVSHGIYCGDSSGFEDARATELRKRATEWRLLLQIDSDEEAGMLWGDAGRIYFCLRREDLAARNFDAAHTILQCG